MQIQGQDPLTVRVIYEDNHVVCAVKPPGVLSQADGTGAPDMLTILKRYIKEKYNKQGDVYLGLVHRLDRPVGGVMAFARTSKAAGRLSSQLRSRSVDKTYYAVLHGLPAQAAGRLEHYIEKDALLNRVRVTGAERTDKGLALLDYSVLGHIEPDAASDKALALVRVELVTGRPHQIRAQFAYIGCPVIGDRKYGLKATSQHGPGGSYATASGAPGSPYATAPGSSYATAPGAPGSPYAKASGSPYATASGSPYATAPRAPGSSYTTAPGGPVDMHTATVRGPGGPALWAASLGFMHPVRQTPVTVFAPPPLYEYPWNLFSEDLFTCERK